MFGLGKAAAKASDAAFGTDFSTEEVAEQLEEVTTQYYQKVEEPVRLTAVQVGPVKPYVKDPQADFNHLVELFGVLGEPTKFIVCSCPNCDHEERGLHSAYSSTAMDQIVACSNCEYEDEFAEFYDETVTDFQTSRNPTLSEIVLTIGTYSEEEYDLDESYVQEHLSEVRQKVLKYYAILSGKEEIEIGSNFEGPMFLNHSGVWVVKHKRGWHDHVRDLRFFGQIKSLQAVTQESNDE